MSFHMDYSPDHIGHFQFLGFLYKDLMKENDEGSRLYLTTGHRLYTQVV